MILTRTSAHNEQISNSSWFYDLLSHVLHKPIAPKLIHGVLKHNYFIETGTAKLLLSSIETAMQRAREIAINLSHSQCHDNGSGRVRRKSSVKYRIDQLTRMIAASSSRHGTTSKLAPSGIWAASCHKRVLL